MQYSEFLFKALSLKDIKRTGWILIKASEPESIASHSFSTALLCLLFAEKEGLDSGHCAKLAIAHDLHESISGDLVLKEHDPENGVSVKEKKEEEKKAADEIFSLIPETELCSLHKEFALQKTKEAVFVRDMDLLDACLQAVFYSDQNRILTPINEFFETAEKRISTKTGKSLLMQLKNCKLNKRHSGQKH